MKAKYKLSIIISIQILLIVGSFTFLAYIENERSQIGNSINIAGKNRFLSVVAHNNIQDALFGINQENPMKGFDALEENLILLEQGGTKEDLNLKQLPKFLMDDYEKTYDKFLKFKNMGKSILIQSTQNPTVEKHIEFDHITNQFIIQADLLVDKLSIYHNTQSDQLLTFEIILMFGNVGIHLFMIYLVIAIFRSESQRRLKLEKFSSIGELSARIAHDLRNPLSVIKMSFELIKQENSLSEKTAEKIPRIERAIKRMSHQIDDVMDFIRSRPLSLHLYRFDDIVQETLDHLEIPKTVEVIHQKSDMEIYCDRQRFVVLLSNIIQNAIQAMNESGKIFIHIETKPLQWKIFVENTGPPISFDLLEKIFDPLVTTYEKGTGLGLATCYNIVSEHNGKIYAKNNPTTFIISLPKRAIR